MSWQKRFTSLPAHAMLESIPDNPCDAITPQGHADNQVIRHLGGILKALVPVMKPVKSTSKPGNCEFGTHVVMYLRVPN